MSEFHVSVVQLEKMAKHPFADTLSITQVLGRYPVIFRTEDYKPGDKVVYIPVDAVLPSDDPQWEFLGDSRRVKAKRLRGIFSMGLLAPAKDEWELGQNVQKELGITKYEPPLFMSVGGDNEYCPFHFPEYTDIEGLRKYPNLISIGTECVFLEKIHGTNVRFLYKDDRLWCGSHHCIKKESDTTVWWKVAKQYNLVEELVKCPNLILCGEIYGWVQDLKYGVKNPGELKLAFFDAFDLDTNKYMDFDDFVYLLKELRLPVVPMFHRGPWQGYDAHIHLGEGYSHIDTVGSLCIREGFVVKPVVEQWNEKIVRLILKYAGQQYLTRKNG